MILERILKLAINYQPEGKVLLDQGKDNEDGTGQKE